MKHAMVLLLLFQAMLACASEKTFFKSDARKQAFLKALKRRDRDYDPAARMIRRRFSSPGYHTTLKGGMVHPTRDSLAYAVALLDAGEPERTRRACDIIARVISLQDQNPKSRTYGIWSWFYEEPLDKMAPPDWNWADFCGALLLQAALDHQDKLPPDLAGRVKGSILHACRSIIRRNVGPGYTNIALMGTYVTLVTGEHFNVPDIRDYGLKRLKRFWDYTNQQGSFSEYNSPTYSLVAIREIARMKRHVASPEALAIIDKLNQFAWAHVARHFHPPTGQWAGPHSRCYSTLVRPSTLAFIQQATRNQVAFLPAGQAAESLDAHRIQPACPQDLFHYFTALPEPRLTVETFQKRKAPRPNVVGTTWLDRTYTLGSLNCGDLWHQRRPLLAYFKTAHGTAAFRVRCLHDGYDYSSASIFNVQDRNTILGAVTFATDRGDTHISLDRLKNGTIQAEDLRIRFEIEGRAPEAFALPSAGALTDPFMMRIGRHAMAVKLIHAAFGEHAIALRTGKKKNTGWTAVELYAGRKKALDFNKLEKACVFFAMAILPADATRPQCEALFRDITRNESKGCLTTQWARPGKPSLSLTVPLKPGKTGDVLKKAAARIDANNPWR